MFSGGVQSWTGHVLLFVAIDIRQISLKGIGAKAGRTATSEGISWALLFRHFVSYSLQQRPLLNV